MSRSTEFVSAGLRAERYIRRIRNPHKRAYAWAWLAYCKGDAEHPARPTALSSMGAQAVRLRLAQPEQGEWKEPADAVMGFLIGYADGKETRS